jgi:hypothetical protein
VAESKANTDTTPETRGAVVVVVALAVLAVSLGAGVAQAVGSKAQDSTWVS